MIGCGICPSGQSRFRQTFAAIVANLSTIAAGMLTTWTSPITPQLMKDTTPVGTEPMTEYEISWLSSIIGIAALIALLFYAIVAQKISNRILGCILSISAMASWLLIYFADNFYYLLLARTLAGFVCGITYSMIPVYVSDIAENSIRGQLGSFLSFGVNLGVLASFILGAQLSYHAFALCGTIVPLVFLAGFMSLPESPSYLLRKGYVEEATRSLMWLRCADKRGVVGELVQLQKHLTSHSGKSVGLGDLFRDRGTIKALIIAVTLYAGQHTCGYAIIFTYTATIFELAHSPVNPDLAAIVTAAIQIIGSCISTLTIDRFGRRTLLLGSCTGIIISHCTFGFFYVLQSRYDLSSVSWLPLVTMSTYALVYSAGLGPSISIVSSEVFSPDIVSLGLPVALSTEFIFNFATTFAFPLVTTTFGIHVSFFILALFTGVTLTIIYFVLPETKGKSKLAIFEELNGHSEESKDIALTLEWSRYSTSTDRFRFLFFNRRRC